MIDAEAQAQAAETLWRAQQRREPCAPLSERFADLDVADAYAIQHRNIARRLQGEAMHGGRAVRLGHKVGLTSEAVQAWLKVDQPDFGTLLDDMSVPDGGRVDTSVLLQPRAEAEIAFLLGDDLRGPGVTAAQVIAATEAIVCAIEIIDSRIDNWAISYVDTIADNASSALFVLGSQPVPLAQAGDLAMSGMVLRKNGRVVSTGAGLACLGHPVNAVAWLANALAPLGDGLRRGDIVLAGALGPVCEVAPGDWLEAEIARVGRASVRFG